MTTTSLPTVHDDDCLPGDRCVACGGCDCPDGEPRHCPGPSGSPEGCYSVDEHDQTYGEMGYEDGCAYGCHHGDR